VRAATAGADRARAVGDARPVPAPTAPDELVFVRVAGVAPHGLESLQSLLWRSNQRVIGLKDGLGAVPGLLDRARHGDRRTDNVGPRGADFPGVFAHRSSGHAAGAGVVGGSTATLTYRFYEQRITSLATPSAG